MKRCCYYADEVMVEQGHVALVTENSPGYLGIALHPDERDLMRAKAKCERVNTELGLSEDDVRDIVASSMRQGKVAEK